MSSRRVLKGTRHEKCEACLGSLRKVSKRLGVTVDDVRAIASTLPRSYEVLVHDRVKFRVGRLVYIALSRDEQTMGFAFPKEERTALVESEPEKFQLPPSSDMRYHWVEVRLDQIDDSELTEIVIQAWEMAVPKRVASAYHTEAD
jgi:hypothetical protein